jgi:hypothetical protein
MYFDDPRGKFTSIYGTPVTRLALASGKEFRKEQAMNKGKNVLRVTLIPSFVV